jgi:hypothetical protein
LLLTQIKLMKILSLKRRVIRRSRRKSQKTLQTKLQRKKIIILKNMTRSLKEI